MLRAWRSEERQARVIGPAWAADAVSMTAAVAAMIGFFIFTAFVQMTGLTPVSFLPAANLMRRPVTPNDLIDHYPIMPNQCKIFNGSTRIGQDDGRGSPIPNIEATAILGTNLGPPDISGGR